MTISYKWLLDYLPVSLEPERMEKILTSIGLEVESMEPYENIRGALRGLFIGEVLTCEQHPNADKLKVTTVNIGQTEALQIVCGAANVAAGQKVVVAPVGSTIHPIKGGDITMKVAKIRGVESFGMICAEDEIGISEDHAGIIVLPSQLQAGTPAAEHFKIHTDWIYEIGLTPNRMDAMSHLGVARDVAAYLTHHDKKDHRVKNPNVNSFKSVQSSPNFPVTIENKEACRRYSGVIITNVTVKPSPEWLQQRLLSIGQRPINNIVDITNFILHESGQPLHAFDLAKISGAKIIVKNLPEGTPFLTLDEKERKLSAEDLMICDGDSKGMCIAGVFGGVSSGVSDGTTAIFLESAWFDPVNIRKTSFRHNLRTEAAMHFEKNVDISNTVTNLKRAALLIKEIAGGVIASDIVDIYPDPQEKPQVTLKYHYLKKLSGKNYHPDSVRKILQALGFEIDKDGMDDIRVNVPYSKPDIHLPADVVEEIMRIDGYDNIEIPTSITISPSVESEGHRHALKEKIAGFLTGQSFNEIFTNSITNAQYFPAEKMEKAVRLLNNLSAVHNVMRPSMLETGLEAISYNLNRKNLDLRFFEFGKTYQLGQHLQYSESEHLCLYVTGDLSRQSWKQKSHSSDIYYLKGIVGGLLRLAGFEQIEWGLSKEGSKLNDSLEANIDKEVVAEIGVVSKQELDRFDIRQPVYFADVRWQKVLDNFKATKISYSELPKQLPVYRDLAMVVSKEVKYKSVEEIVSKAKLDKLREVRLFDVFESEKLGGDKKSLAISLTFLDPEKTMTDKEIDAMMNKVMNLLEAEIGAEIRKQ